MATTSLFFDIFARDKGVSDTLDKIGGKAQDTDNRFGKFGDTMGKLAAPAAVGLGAVGALALKFGDMAADAEQNVGAVETVFGKAADKVLDFSDKSALAVGLSSSQYQQLSATTGTALKAAGVSFDDLAQKNDELITRGADLASVFGGTTAEAVQAMGSAFRGEFDPLERYGLTLNMNTVNAKMAADGTDKLTGAALEQAKKQTIMNIIMEQSADKAGNFARESDTAAGAQQRAAASFEDAGAKLGEKLLPFMTQFATVATDMAKWAAENSDLLTNLAIVFGVLAGGIVVASTAMTVANIVMAANPIGAVILAVTALIAVIVLLAANWDKVVAFITDKWNGLTGWWSDGMKRIGGQWNDFWSGVGRVGTDIWNGTIGPVFDGLRRTVTETIPNAFRDGARWVGEQWNKLGDVAKAPVRFVIDTVINDGLIGTFNTVAGWIGLKGLGRVPLPRGFATGGYTGDGGKYDPAGIVHAGEFVFTQEETRKAGVGTLANLARSLRGYAQGGFVTPVPGATITQGFSGLNGHNGLDMAARSGTPIRAAFPGNVTFSGWSSYGGGNEIHIQHAGGWETWYAHNSNNLVRPGMVVNRGQQIALMGMTGNATGPHLHYMVMKGGWPNVVDPSPFLDAGADIPAGGIPLNPIADIIGGLVSAFGRSFGGNIMADISIGIGKKLMGDVGAFVVKQLGVGGPKLFDQGGWLDTLAVNRTGRPEAVLTPQQSIDFHRLATQGISLDGYTLELNADATKATFRKVARAEATGVLDEYNDEIYRGRAR